MPLFQDLMKRMGALKEVIRGLKEVIRGIKEVIKRLLKLLTMEYYYHFFINKTKGTYLTPLFSDTWTYYILLLNIPLSNIY